MLIRNAEIEERRCDVRIAGDVVTGFGADLPIEEGEPVIDADGAAIIPGLHDHHIHLDATAAALASVRCGPPEVTSFADLADVLEQAPGNGWLRGVGYHDGIGLIDRAWLDRHGPDRPIRIQHRGGRMWVFNSRALALIGEGFPADGRLVDGDQIVAARIGRLAQDLGAVGAMLAARGVTGLTEVTPRNTHLDHARYTAALLPQRLHVMGDASLDAVPGVGAVKLHYHEHDLPSLDHLISEVARAHEAGRAIASHCVTLAELTLTLSAIEAAGANPGDRIEHAAVAPPHAIERIARLGCTVVTQPHFITERGDAYLREVDGEDRPWLYRLRGFHDAGVPLAAGSDAPFGNFDPWQSMAAAVARPAALSPEESLTPEAALGLYLGPLDAPGAGRRRIALGGPADLCLLDRPWSVARRDLAAVMPRLTIAAGKVVYGSIRSMSPQASA